MDELLKGVPFMVAAADELKPNDLVAQLNTANAGINETTRDLTWYSTLSLLKSAPLIWRSLLTDIKSIKDTSKGVLDLREKYRTKAFFWKNSAEKNIVFLTQAEYGEICEKVETLKGHHLFLCVSDKYDSTQLFKCCKYFLDLKESEKFIGTYYIVDLDVNPVENVAGPDSPKICHIIDGKNLSIDVEADLKAVPRNNVIKHEGVEAVNFGSREKRALFAVPCPKCRGPPVPWSCLDCGVLFEYCFDNTLHCSCGTVTSALKYRCGNYFHLELVPDSDKFAVGHVKELRPAPQANLLLIGQSGVGKSTWINGMANCLQFMTLGNAMAHEPVTLIPGQFTLYDDGKEHRIVVGTDINEASSVGESATQTCRSYVLYHKGIRVTLIDTPGLGDTRGPDQDLQNVQDILHMLSIFSNIHGVCMLLLPDETRAHATLRYTIIETLSYFHKSVITNLFFIFTNSRGTHYRLGATHPILEKIMSDSRRNFEFSKNNIYMFDNEAYRFLCAKKKTSIKFSDEDQELYDESWSKSSSEFRRLLKYVSSIPPYSSQKTLDMGHIRFKMLSVMGLVLDVVSTKSVENYRDEIKRCEDKLKLLEKNKSIDTLVVKENPCQPRVVCIGPRCTRVEAGATIYQVTCIKNCTASTRFKTLPNAELRTTTELGSGTCTRCGCNWEKHMLLNFEQVVEKKAKTDANIEAEIKQTKDNIKKCVAKIDAVEEDKEVSAAKRDKLETFSRLLAKYFAQHAFFLYNDAVVDYLAYLIDTADTKANKTEVDKLRVKELQLLRDKSSELARIVEKLKNVEYVPVRGENFLSVKDIIDRQQKLGIELKEETTVAEKTLRTELRLLFD